MFVKLKRYAAANGRTMSDVVETALRRLLESRPPRAALPPLPSFDGGGTLVDVANGDQLLPRSVLTSAGALHAPPIVPSASR